MKIYHVFINGRFQFNLGFYLSQVKAEKVKKSVTLNPLDYPVEIEEIDVDEEVEVE